MSFYKAKGSALETLNTLYQSRTIDATFKVTEVIKIFDDTNVKEETELLISEYYLKAMESIERIDVSPARKEILSILAQKIMTRNS